MNAGMIFLPVAVLVSMTDWYPPEIAPVRVGIYKVRIQLGRLMPVNTAYWNGTEWRDTENGLECYFQTCEWQGLTEEGMETVRRGPCVA